MALNWTKEFETTEGTYLWEFYGNDIAMSGDGTIVAVSSPTQNKKVYVYKKVDGTWNSFGTHINIGINADTYRLAMSADGLTIAVGIINMNVSGNRYELRVYTWSGNAWNEKGLRISESSGGISPGPFSIALSGNGNVLILGDAYHGNPDAGRVIVYTWSGSAWNVESTLDTIGTNRYGYSVSISRDGSRFAVSEPYYSEGGLTERGRVIVYQRSGSVILDQFKGSVSNMRLGTSVSLSGDGKVIAIGSEANNGKGRVDLFEESGGLWSSRVSSFIGTENFGYVGTSVALSNNGSTLLYGTRNNEAFIYRWNGSAWNLIGNVLAFQNSCGIAISDDGNTFAIGSTGDNKLRVYSVDILRPANDVTTLQELLDAIADPSIQEVRILNDIDGILIIQTNTGIKILKTNEHHITLSH